MFKDKPQFIVNLSRGYGAHATVVNLHVNIGVTHVEVLLLRLTDGCEIMKNVKIFPEIHAEW